MRIAMIGQKGVPATHGGVERHVEELARRIVARGHEVTVYTRPNYTERGLASYEGIMLRSLPTVGTKHLDAIVHCALSSFDAWGHGYDIVHYHAIGPALTAPIARARGRATVATIHAQDWRRQKWGGLASRILRMGEWCALNVARETICVSERLTEQYVAEGHRVTYVPNGIALNDGDDTSILDELGVSDGGYLLFAGRVVPEKGAHYLIEAWRAAGRPMPLVIAGDTSFSDGYVNAVKASQAEGVLFPGYVYGARLAALFRHAALFVLPSDLEGLPIVLLEALGYGAPVLASDIVPNVEVLGDKGRYFEAGDIESLARELSRAIGELGGLRDRAGTMREEALAEYDWDRVTDMTLDVYDRAVGARAR